MKIDSIRPLPFPHAHAVAAPGTWNVVERRIVIIDGVRVQYEYANRTSRDGNGVLQDDSSVSMVWPHGMKVMSTDGFDRGMSDAALVHKLRAAIFALTGASR